MTGRIASCTHWLRLSSCRLLQTSTSVTQPCSHAIHIPLLKLFRRQLLTLWVSTLYDRYVHQARECFHRVGYCKSLQKLCKRYELRYGRRFAIRFYRHAIYRRHRAATSVTVMEDWKPRLQQRVVVSSPSYPPTGLTTHSRAWTERGESLRSVCKRDQARFRSLANGGAHATVLARAAHRSKDKPNITFRRKDNYKPKGWCGHATRRHLHACVPRW